ncbi:Pr6Pr family membrane protein [Isoptericola sp. b490]|nr:Pr6Pr family membrane protein [Isoptericola sp. b490]
MTDKVPVPFVHALVAVLALGGVAIELVLAVTAGPESGLAGRLARGASYFTIQSNILVGGVSALLALRPSRGGPVFRVLRLDAVVCVAVTGILYHTGVGSMPHPSFASVVSDLLLHTVTPVATVLAWFVAGPRIRLSWAAVAWSLVPPLAYAAYVVGNGALNAWYPYPFFDPAWHGYRAVLGNVGLASLLFIALGALVRQLEGLLGPRPTNA